MITNIISLQGVYFHHQVMHQFCTACQSQGWGITKFCAAPRWAFANPVATPKLLAIRGFPSEYNYTEELTDAFKLL